MDTQLKIQSLSRIANIADDFSQFDNDYIFAHITARNLHREIFSQSMRFDGLTLVLCNRGTIRLNVNMHACTMKAGSFLVVGSSSVLNLTDVDPENLDAYVLILSTEFMRNVAIDLNTMSASSGLMSPDHKPIINLTDDETSLLVKYLELFHLNTLSNTTELYVKSIARTLMAAIIYQLMQIAASHANPQESTARPYSRKMNYVQDFMALVYKHYRQERSVGFYADKLFISPKYLSLIIKEATGRSAADWIDECVIIEAKNLLRFSGKNVQQIAYELNFNNQSSFGKYFKHLTGQSPTQFQQS